MSIVPVEVIRPEPSSDELGQRAVLTFGTPFLRGWLLMLALGVIPPAPHLGYWPCVLVSVAAATFTSAGDYKQWTRKRGVR